MTVEETGQLQPVEQSTQAPTEPSQPQTEITPESEAQTDPKPKGDADPVQKRINQLTWQRHETERRLNAEIVARQQAEHRAREIEAQAQEWLRRANTPRFEQFQDPAQYEQAVQQHYAQHLEQQRKSAEEQQRAQQQMIAQAQFQQRINAYIEEGTQKYPDFNEVVSNPALPPLGQVNPAVLQAILDQPDLAYFLGKNPGEAHRIAALPPHKAILEVGKVAERLVRSSRPTSQAPAPPPTVGGKQRVSEGASDSDSIEDWVRKREADLRRKGMR